LQSSRLVHSGFQGLCGRPQIRTAPCEALSALALQYLLGGEIVRSVVFLFAVAGLLTIGVSAQAQNSSNAQDESELRRIESETAKFEQQNDSKWTDLLADDWVLLGNNKNLTKSDLQANVKQNFAAHNGPNPYTIEKENMRVDLFGDTAVVTYIKEYRQTADTTKVHDEDNTDVFTRSSKGWRLRLTKVSPFPAKSN
jgi:ketosteroid isomerase-like protein